MHWRPSSKEPLIRSLYTCFCTRNVEKNSSHCLFDNCSNIIPHFLWQGCCVNAPMMTVADYSNGSEGYAYNYYVSYYFNPVLITSCSSNKLSIWSSIGLSFLPAGGSHSKESCRDCWGIQERWKTTGKMIKLCGLILSCIMISLHCWLTYFYVSAWHSEPRSYQLWTRRRKHYIIRWA